MYRVNKKGLIEKRSNEYSIKVRYPELYNIAEKLAKELSVKINDLSKDVKSEMPYKAQGILESLIYILEKSV